VSQSLVLLRHGQSEWNARNRFTGRADPDLTATGEREAAAAGRLLAAHGLPPGLAHTSLQRRAVRSTELALAACDRGEIPVRRSWRLNGRDYGALQGWDKDEAVRRYGEEQVLAWRRSYAVAPPRGESLRDVTARLLPYWYDSIVPDLCTGQCVLVVSHGNTLRALIKHLDGIGDDEIAGLEIPNGVPLCYQLDPHMRPVARGGRRLAG